MIQRADIEKLAQLARIDIPEREIESLASSIDAILGYVGQISSLTLDVEQVIPTLHNVMREDVIIHQPRQFSEDLLSNAPYRDGDYVEVKKILG